MGKRIFDIVVASSALLICLPIFCACAVVIFIFDGRPVFFSQSRIGKNCAVFTMYKFRTMLVVKTVDLASDWATNKRITRIGRFLRKTKLDEIPQLWNVIRGDMSIVGPRPLSDFWLKKYNHPHTWHQVYSVRPGITGPGAVIYRDESEILLAQGDNAYQYYETVLLPEKLSLYKKYVQRQSLWYDVKILYCTVRALLGKTYTRQDFD